MNLWRVPIDEATGAVLGSPESITTGGIASHQHLSVSSDGRHIAYVEGVGTANIHRTTFDPNEETVEGQSVPITKGSLGARNPDTSSDGKWIVFLSGSIQEDIFIVRTDGTGLRQLTDDIYKDRRPLWSPDGEWIAFYSNRTGSYEIWTIHPDGSGLRQLTKTPDHSSYEPTWSPDGSRFVYYSNGTAYIQEFSMQSGEIMPIVLPPINEAGDAIIPEAWSPDGKMLAGTSDRPIGQHAGLYLYSLESREFQELSVPGSGLYSPRWLSDSRRLLFTHEGKLFLLDIETNEHRELFRMEAPALMGGRLSITPDNRTIYFEHIVNESDIWMLTLE
jgi:Tol biopolymer transport system component